MIFAQPLHPAMFPATTAQRNPEDVQRPLAKNETVILVIYGCFWLFPALIVVLNCSPIVV
jgi:hypothetical protein